jgi:hypothetical protein
MAAERAISQDDPFALAGSDIKSARACVLRAASSPEQGKVDGKWADGISSGVEKERETVTVLSRGALDEAGPAKAGSIGVAGSPGNSRSNSDSHPQAIPRKTEMIAIALGNACELFFFRNVMRGDF